MFVSLIIYYLFIETNETINKVLFNDVKELVKDIHSNLLYKEKPKTIILLEILDEISNILNPSLKLNKNCKDNINNNSTKKTIVDTSLPNSVQSSSLSSNRDRNNTIKTNNSNNELNNIVLSIINSLKDYSSNAFSYNDIVFFKSKKISRLEEVFNNHEHLKQKAIIEFYFKYNKISDILCNFSYRNNNILNYYDYIRNKNKNLYLKNHCFEAIDERNESSITSNIFSINSNSDKPKRESINSINNLKKIHFFDILLCSPIDIANQLTVESYNLLSCIKPIEFVGCRWSKKNKNQAAPTIVKFIDRFNKLYLWVIEELLCYDKKSIRCKVIEKFIAVAIYLRELRNFNDLVIILSALNSTIVKSLEKTIKMVNSMYKKIWIELALLCSYDNNYSLLRKSHSCNAYSDDYYNLVEKCLTNSNNLSCKVNEDNEIVKDRNSKFSKSIIGGFRYSFNTNFTSSLLRKMSNSNSIIDINVVNKDDCTIKNNINNSKFEKINNEQTNEDINNIFNSEYITPTIPYLGLFLRDISYSSEGDPYTKSGHLVNIDKVLIQSFLIFDFIQYKNIKYKNLKNNPLLSFLKNPNPKSEEELYSKIIYLEPKFKLFKHKSIEKRLSNTDYNYYYVNANNKDIELINIIEYPLIINNQYIDKQLYKKNNNKISPLPTKISSMYSDTDNQLNNSDLSLSNITNRKRVNVVFKKR